MITYVIAPGVLIIVGLLVAFSIMFFFHQARALPWGAVVAIMDGSLFFGFVPNLALRLCNPSCSSTPIATWSLFILESIPLLIGSVGGIWGFFSARIETSHPKVLWFLPRLMMGMVPLGLIGVMSTFNGQLSEFGLIWLLGPLLVIYCAVQLELGRGSLRRSGTFVVVGSLPSLALSLIVAGEGVEWYTPREAPGVVGTIAWLVTIILGLSVIFNRASRSSPLQVATNGSFSFPLKD